MAPRWRSFNKLEKFLYTSSVFISALSIGSLADSVYKFKGLIANAIELWHQVGFFVIGYLPESFRIDLVTFDAFTVISLTFGPLLFSLKDLFPTEWKIYVLPILCYFSFPFYFGREIMFLIIILSYIPFLVVSLMPPRTDEFNFLAIRMLSPIILLVVVTAVTEGIMRPL
ncbi:hypothetical protein [Vibrio natriegens]|uniref:Uncharacterized protein n=2 Tax=Vibrio natriegens TaxID=691 RepID=A0AAN0Y315_VIBNA|nr:hypothetical protein [Vibrio natriegens]ALR15755.1 hypothetical protein PN96_07065 [Vibrio natriegens NBRC 15636 = ATCC 14048 = DSM 759]ANQ12385.1 hypothetical protein BA890_06285 [Vibrio natriegens NBRC 15636 = ATCC 14048 = DSM 759]MDX6026763.1 hypothetical protein [Vibrio natriegens NBRC 15636 = ATCC 14048 = DSM 759]UUI12845.1 hypothetical protein NP431_06280 [Vibrio natriegens]